MRGTWLLALVGIGCFATSPEPGAPCAPQLDNCPSEQACRATALGFECQFESDPADTCGSGVVVVTEQCDDGNADSGDGCAADCTMESGWTCAGVPSSCDDIDECATANGGCGANAACFNSTGSYSCVCDPGYVGDGIACAIPMTGSTAFPTAGTQIFTVPGGVTSITVELWGAGGGGGGGRQGLVDPAGVGGGGAAAAATLAVTPGEALVIDVGAGGGGGRNEDTALAGINPGGAGGAPGGGKGGDMVSAGWLGPSGGGGGGYSAISRGGSRLVVAGGGGGGGGDSTGAMGAPNGGAAGLTAANGTGAVASANGGGGATAAAPGSAGTGSVNGQAGSSLAGGAGPPAVGNGRGAGGGGGGGRFGGGSGLSGSSSDQSGGGGGGSSFELAAGAIFVSGSGATPGKANDPDNAGAGGGGARITAGRAGRVVVRW